MKILRVVALAVTLVIVVAAPVAARQQIKIGGHLLRITEVFDRSSPLVEVKVDGASYRAGIGDSFGPGQDLEVRQIRPSSGCARFRYDDGDVRDIFRLCVR